MSKQHYLVIDVKYCMDCNNCFISCKDEHVDNDWLPYVEAQPRHGHRWMNIHRRERGMAPRVEMAYLPTPCQHCEEAPCMKANPDCIERREDGIVMILPDKARGKKNLVDNCPYGAIFWNEEKNVAQKCTLCAHLIDDPEGWAPAMPRCAHSCPTQAIQHFFLEPAEMEKKIQDEELEVHKPQLGTKPHVFYKNHYRYVKHFIAGAAIMDKDCWENATVTLKGNGVDLKETTDYLGEFKFDKLEAGEYTLSVEGNEIQTLKIEESTDVGDLFFWDKLPKPQ